MAALDQIIRDAPRPVSVWLMPGDLNHGRMTIEDRNYLARRLKAMADEAPIVICYGNHDLPGDLDVFALLGSVWPIRVIARPQTVCFATSTGEMAAVFVLPFPTRAGLVGAGVPSDQIGTAARQALDAIFMQAATDLRDATADGYVPLMIGHVNVAGSITSSGQPNIGQEIEIDQALLDRLGPIYKGLNHIHKAQEIGSAVYAGSCCRLDYGEIEAKRYLVIDYLEAA